VEWKGQHIALDAFAKIADTHPNARLVIVGGGPDSDFLKRKAADLGVENRVEFPGSCSAATVRKMLGESDVFLQHSLTHRSGWGEGFGVSIAEASAMALPVIVSPCGGIVDQVIDGETGIIVPEHDREAMAAAMRKLAADPELRHRMGEAGRRRMRGHFDTKAQVRKLEDVLTRAIRNGS